MIIIENLDENKIKEIYDLYVKSFPEIERKPFTRMINKYNEKVLDILYICNTDNIFVGFAIIMKTEKLVLVDYLAIRSSFRGLGYGSRILEYIKNTYIEKEIIYEIECEDEKADNYLERKRRKNFYLQNGLKNTNLLVNLFGVEMEVLSYSGKFLSFKDYLNIYFSTYPEQRQKFITKIKMLAT